MFESWNHRAAKAATNFCHNALRARWSGGETGKTDENSTKEGRVEELAETERVQSTKYRVVECDQRG